MAWANAGSRGPAANPGRWGLDHQGVWGLVGALSLDSGRTAQTDGRRYDISPSMGFPDSRRAVGQGPIRFARRRPQESFPARLVRTVPLCRAPLRESDDRGGM